MYRNTTEAMPDFTEPEFFKTFGTLARDRFNCASAYIYTLTASLMGLDCVFYREQSLTGRSSQVFPNTYKNPEFFSISAGKTSFNFWASASEKSLSMRDAINTGDKLSIKKSLFAANISTPIGGVANAKSTEVFKNFQKRGINRVIVKPLRGSLSKGILADVSLDVAKAHIKFNQSETFLFEEFITGTEIRCHTIDFKAQTVYLRDKLHITGDGTKSVLDLVNDMRSLQLSNPFTASAAIEIPETLHYLTEIGVERLYVPNYGERIILSPSKYWNHRNAMDITENTTPNLKQALKATSKALNLRVAAIDAIISKNDILYILEANTKPAGLIWGFPIVGEWNLKFPEAVMRWHFPKWRSTIRRIKSYDFLSLMSDYQNLSNRNEFNVAEYIQYE